MVNSSGVSGCSLSAGLTVPVFFSGFCHVVFSKGRELFSGHNKGNEQETCGYRRRQESIVKSTNLLEPMVKGILSHGIRVGYILMDSWFGMAAIISRFHKHLPVICMVKNTPKIHYGLEACVFL